MHQNTNQMTYRQSDFDALAMAIEDGRWTNDDPRAAAIVAAAQARGLSTPALAAYADPTAPVPVRERALACIAGQLLTGGDFALAG